MKKTAAPPGMIRCEELSELTGWSPIHLRQIAAAGWFPPPVKNCYDIKATMAGSFRYLQEKVRKRELADAGLTALREEKRRKLEMERLEAESNLVERSEVSTALRNLYANQRHYLNERIVNQLTRDLVGKDYPEVKTLVENCVDDVIKTIRESTHKWCLAPPKRRRGRT